MRITCLSDMKVSRYKSVYFVSTCLILLVFYVITLLFHFQNLEIENRRIQLSDGFRFRKHSVEFKSGCDTVLAIILCETNSTNNNSPAAASNFDRQINQTLVMLKSIVITAKFSSRLYSCIKVIIICDKRDHFEKLKEEIFERQGWDVEFTKYLRLSYVPVNYPEGFDWMHDMFRPCATLRLFLSDLLLPLNYDTVIYLDTDIIFLRDVRDLWSTELEKFTNETLGAMAPCLFHYGSKKNNVPYFGSSGLNAGIMLMNFTRMKNTLWTRKIHLVAAMFQHQIKLADQDLLNIYFHYFPDEVNLISCDWNFRPFQCREGSHCEDTQLSQGISALHGNALSFTPNGPEPLFHSVFHTIETTDLSSRSKFNITHFVDRINYNLVKIEERAHSDCSKFGGLSALVMNRLVQMK